MNSKRTQVAVLLAIVVVGLLVRLRGIGHQLPHWTYLDGYAPLAQMSYLEDPTSIELPDPNLGYYPYLTAAVATCMPNVMTSRDEGGERETELARAREPWVRLRLSSVLLSMLGVVGAWGIARRWMSPRFALFAAALTATSLLHVTYSAEQRPHGPASGTAALAVWALLAFRRDGSWRAAIVAITALGLGIAALQSNFALLVSALLALWLRRESFGWRRALGVILVGLAALAVVVRIAYPFHFDDRAGPAAPFDPGEDAIWLGGHPIFLGRITGRGFGTLANTFFAFDPVLTALVALAAVLALWQLVRVRSNVDAGLRSEVWVCAGYVATFVIVFGMYDATYDRFALPLVPFAAIAAAWALERAWSGLPTPWRSGASGVVALVLVLVFPSATVWRLAQQRAGRDTFELAADWLANQQRAAPARVFLLQNFDLPLLYSAESLLELNDSQTLFWTKFQRARDGDDAPRPFVARAPRSEGEEQEDFIHIDWLRRRNFDYVVALPPPRGVRGSETLDALRKLRKDLELVATFAPTDEVETKRTRGAAPNTSITESGTAMRVWSVERSGPRLELFRVPTSN